MGEVTELTRRKEEVPRKETKEGSEEQLSAWRTYAVELASELRTAIGPLLGVGAVFGLFVVVAPAQFYSVYNIKTIVTQSVITGIGALGMALVIISAGIDLSVGSQIALATVVVARVLGWWGEEPSSIGVVVAVLAAVGACGLCGLLNGVLTAGLRIVPFIVTLGSMQIARGAAKWLGHEQTVLAPETWLNYLMDVDPQPAWLLVAPGVWLLGGLLLVVMVLLRFTVFGRYVFAIGANEATARLCGIRVGWHKTLVYTCCGVLTGIAGVLQFATLTVGDPTAANGMELDIIAAGGAGGGSVGGGGGGGVGGGGGG
ncbi:MAG: ABC transporter permease, partial [bacterium]|nr:ABC transporter permease [bacterium]